MPHARPSCARCALHAATTDSTFVDEHRITIGETRKPETGARFYIACFFFCYTLTLVVLALLRAESLVSSNTVGPRRLVERKVVFAAN
jgi:hypothetical protein